VIRILATLAALCAGPALAAAQTPAPVEVHDLLEATPPAGTEISALDVDNRLGDIRIIGHDGRGLSIHAFKHAPDADTLNRLEVRLIQDPSGAVSIRTQLATGREGRPIPAGSARVDLIIRVPRTARVDAAVWNGLLRVRGLDNGARVRANDGDIAVVQTSGSIIADSAAGHQRFSEIFGEIESRALVGDVDMSVIRGKRLEASVHTGSVRARRVKVGTMIIRVIKGDIRVDAEVIPGGHYVIASYHGNVEARLSKGSSARLRARSRGAAEIDLPERLRPQKTSANEVLGYLGNAKSPADFDIQAGGKVVVAEF
jgi:hypothetical protein